MKSFIEKMKYSLKYGSADRESHQDQDDRSLKNVNSLSSFAEISNITYTPRTEYKKKLSSPKKNVNNTPKSPKVRRAHEVKTSPKKEKSSKSSSSNLMFGCFSACFSDPRGLKDNKNDISCSILKHSNTDDVSKSHIDMKDSLIEVTPRRSVMKEEAPPEPQVLYFLPPQTEANKGRKTLILDIDETLVHSSLEVVPNPDLTLKLIIDQVETMIYVKIRPGVSVFLQAMSKIYEVVTFTASTKPYATEVLRNLDPEGKYLSGSLHREHCTFIDGVYTKNLNLIGRPIQDLILLDNSPISFMLQPSNGLIIKNFYDDPSDLELLNMIPFLNFLSKVEDVRPICDYRVKYEGNEEFNIISRESKKQESFNLCARKNHLDAIPTLSQSEISTLLQADPLNLYYKRHLEGLIETKRTRILSLMVYNGNPKNVAESQKISNSKKRPDISLQEEQFKRVLNQELQTSVKEFSVNELTNMTNKENETGQNTSRRD